jgi:hypothetical protein
VENAVLNLEKNRHFTKTVVRGMGIKNCKSQTRAKYSRKNETPIIAIPIKIGPNIITFKPRGPIKKYPKIPQSFPMYFGGQQRILEKKCGRMQKNEKKRGKNADRNPPAQC